MMNTQTIDAPPIQTAAKLDYPVIIKEENDIALLESFSKIYDEVSQSYEPKSGATPGVKLTGLISFVGDVDWNLVLIFPQDGIEYLASKFAGFDIEFDSPDLDDVVGEITNIVAGVVSGRLEKRGIKVQMSMPSVIRGEGFEHVLPENFVRTRSDFEVDGHYFYARVIAKSNKKVN